MSVRKRFMLHFGLQLVILGVILILLMVGTIGFILHQWNQLEMETNFPRVGLPALMNSFSEENERIAFDPDLLEKVKQNGAWLQMLNEKGDVIASHFTPEDVPRHYNAGELVDYWYGNKPFPYRLYIWIAEVKNQRITLIYGYRSQSDRLMDAVTSGAALENGSIEMEPALERELHKASAWIQVLDEGGSEIGSWNRPASSLAFYTPDELILRAEYSYRYGEILSSRYDSESGQTWIVGLPEPFAENRLVLGASNEVEVLWVALLIMLGALALILVAWSYWYATRFGKPLMDMVEWMQNLGEGRYDEPTDRRGVGRSRRQNGKLRWNFRLYTEAVDSLARLTSTLEKNERFRCQVEQTREEWISGVSHDLKTPLSSIKGYAHVLGSPYEWSTEEIRKFAGVIEDKSNDMNQLIEDLSLSYRIKNGSEPFFPEKVPLISFLEETVQRLRQNPMFEKGRIEVTASDPEFSVLIDPLKFRRIIDNLLANALIHNPVGTKVTVSVQRKKHSYSITVQDDGEGMDQHTLERFFDRYYRGVSTTRGTKGTGLGMSIAKHLTQLHGGEIEAESSKGEGTVLRITFPL